MPTATDLAAGYKRGIVADTRTRNLALAAGDSEAALAAEIRIMAASRLTTICERHAVLEAEVDRRRGAA